MSDFPKHGDVSTTRVWLDSKGFNGLFNTWEADALLGTEKDDLIAMVPGENGLKLWGLLNTARLSRENSGKFCTTRLIIKTILLDFDLLSIFMHTLLLKI